MSAGNRSDRSELTITREVVLVAIPRGDEELRVTFTQARTPDGKDVAWHSVRIFWKTEDGQWRPGRQGITIRGREIGAVTAALAKATSGGVAPPAPRQQRPSEPTTQPPSSPSAWAGTGADPEDGLF